MTRSTSKSEEAHLSALRQALQDLQKLDMRKTAYMAGCNFESKGQESYIPIRLFQQDLVVTLPQGSVRTATGEEPDVATQLIVLHYLLHADGVPPSDLWIAFRELPDGMVYDSAFQKRSSLRLVREYGMDAAGFAAAAEDLGGERLTFGDASFRFQALPRVLMAVILHLGDEEFSPGVSVLFDAAAGHYLPIEDLAVLGGMLASRLIKAGNA
jgi:hypothetical protein